jgi:hypothetical protein
MNTDVITSDRQIIHITDVLWDVVANRDTARANNIYVKFRQHGLSIFVYSH